MTLISCLDAPIVMLVWCLFFYSTDGTEVLHGLSENMLYYSPTRPPINPQPTWISELTWVASFVFRWHEETFAVLTIGQEREREGAADIPPSSNDTLWFKVRTQAPSLNVSLRSGNWIVNAYLLVMSRWPGKRGKKRGVAVGEGLGEGGSAPRQLGQSCVHPELLWGGSRAS